MPVYRLEITVPFGWALNTNYLLPLDTYELVYFQLDVILDANEVYGLMAV